MITGSEYQSCRTEWTPSKSVSRQLNYIHGPEGNIVAIWETRNMYNDWMYYTVTDYLGSITDLVGHGGWIEKSRYFDAWGRTRSANTWTEEPPTYGSMTDEGWDRGFTGHEHLPQFGIINMNGRLYDPVMGRMFSPDPYIIGTDNTQGYNRYTYALNNPLSYTDPDGEHPIIVAMAFGALSGAIFGAHAAHSNGRLWYQGALWGGGIGALTGLLGSFAPLGTGWIGSTIYGVGLGAISSGATTYATGRSWEQTKRSAIWGGIAGGIAGFIRSEQFGNAIGGQGFKSNDAVLESFKTKGQHQQAIDYFGFEGTYRPNLHGSDDVLVDATQGDYLGQTSAITGEISYGNSAFRTYNVLKSTYYKEFYSHNKIINGGKAAVMHLGEPTYHVDFAPEERLGFIYTYKNQGLYKGNFMPSIDYYQNRMIGYYGVPFKLYAKKWWHFIYKIPRKW